MRFNLSLNDRIISSFYMTRFGFIGFDIKDSYISMPSLSNFFDVVMIIWISVREETCERYERPSFGVKGRRDLTGGEVSCMSYFQLLIAQSAWSARDLDATND